MSHNLHVPHGKGLLWGLTCSHGTHTHTLFSLGLYYEAWMDV